VKIDSATEKPVRRLRDQLKLVAADAILAAAEEVFAEHGLHAKMEEIAARAGVGVGTLYNHFADRQALLDALAGSRRRALLERLDEGMERVKSAPFQEQLEVFIRALMEHSVAHAGFIAMLIQSERKPRTSEELEHRLLRLMQRGIAQKALRGKQADLYTSALLGMVHGVVLRELRENRPSQLLHLVSPLTTLFLSGAEA
jgi:AcrR family transcriptional regulator